MAAFLQITFICFLESLAANTNFMQNVRVRVLIPALLNYLIAVYSTIYLWNKIFLICGIPGDSKGLIRIGEWYEKVASKLKTFASLNSFNQSWLTKTLSRRSSTQFSDSISLSQVNGGPTVLISISSHKETTSWKALSNHWGWEIGLLFSKDNNR